MADEALIPAEEPQAVDEFAVEGGSSTAGKLKILLFVAAVIAVECLLAWLYIPAAGRTAAMAGAAAEENPDAEAEDELQQAAEEPADWTEVDLGEFSVVSYQPASGTALRVDFQLWGMVHEEEYEELLSLLEHRRHRFREEIQFTVRSAVITELTDERLGLIKRKALEKANKVLGKPLLRVLIFDGFSLIEQ